MTRTITKPVTWVTQLLAAVTMLILTMDMLPASTLTMKAAAAAYERGDYATALVGFLHHAEGGNPGAQFALGFMYANGQGVPRVFSECLRLVKRCRYTGGLEFSGGEGTHHQKDHASADRGGTEALTRVLDALRRPLSVTPCLVGDRVTESTHRLISRPLGDLAAAWIARETAPGEVTAIRH